MRISFLFLLAVFIGGHLSAQEEQPVVVDLDATYVETLERYFALNGSWEAFGTALDQMIDMQKGMYAEISTEFWDEFSKEIKATGKEDLFALLTPIYQKHFSLEDLEAFVAFYETPAGQKLSQKTPQILQESMAVGQEWGMKIGQIIVKRLEERRN